MTLTTVPKPPRYHDGVVRRLTADIVSTRIEPGSLLPPEPELCQQMGVSRTVVREAIRILADKGVVVSEQGRGTRVKPASEWNLLDPMLIQAYFQEGRLRDLVEELLEVRRMFEVAVVDLAASRAGSSRVQGMRRALERMAAAGSVPDDYAAADLDFHKELVLATGNRMFRTLHTSIHEVLQVGFRVNAGTRDITRSIENHQRILRAIEAHRPKAARDAMLVLIAEWERTIRLAIGATPPNRNVNGDPGPGSASGR